MDDKEKEKEKYRKEHPMDYLKAVDLIRQDPQNEVITRTVYDVTRIHIPNLVYKYHSLTENENINKLKLKTLIGKKIYLSKASELNDPFENKAFFYRNDALSNFDSLKHVDGKLIDDFSSYNQLTSFTSVGVNCMPMWAHYANNHQGYCVVYDTTRRENVILSGTMLPV